MDSNEKGRKGVSWRRVKVSNLTPDRQTEYRRYLDAVAAAKSLADALKTKLRQEWESENPDGRDGKTISFTITGGLLQYAMVPMNTRFKKGVSDEGDAVFSRPQSEEPETANSSLKKARLASLLGTVEPSKTSKYVVAAKKPLHG